MHHRYNMLQTFLALVSLCLESDEHKMYIHPFSNIRKACQSQCNMQHVQGRTDKSNMAHAGRALQKHDALLNRQNMECRVQEVEYLVDCLKAR